MRELDKIRRKGVSIPEASSLLEAADIVADHFISHWEGHDQEYFFLRFSEEVEELAGVLGGYHDDTIEVELVELYSILKNWIRRRDRGEWTRAHSKIEE